MRSSRKKLSRIVPFAIVIILIINVVYMGFSTPVLEERKISGTGLQQYVHPHNYSIKGIKFKLSSHSYNLAMQLATQLESEKRVEALTMDSLIEAMTPVTAVSSNHFYELLKHLGKFHRFVPNKRLIVYDLGLTQDEASTLRRIDYIEYRKFDFSVYPKHVRNLHSYAWKPLIIQRVLAEHGGVLWLDSSVKIKKPYTKVLEQMVNNSSGFLYYLTPVGNSIISCTHSKMFEYFPMKNLKERKLLLPQAGGILVFNTPEIRKFIFKWAILCSLVQDCIIPEGSTKYCDPKYPEERTGGCHRHDQSMFAILVTNLYSAETNRYMIAKKLSRYAVVNRLDLPFYHQVFAFLKSWFQTSWIYKTILV